LGNATFDGDIAANIPGNRTAATSMEGPQS
jgi:hypothetical protein